MNKLIQELDSLVIRPFVKSGNGVDTKIISTALLQVIDGILMAPIPIPRDFCAPLPVVQLEWTVRPDASHVAEMNQSSFDVVETFPSVSALVCVHGRLLNATKVRRAIRSIVLSYQIRRLGSLDEDGVTKEALRLRPIASSTSVAIGRQGDFCVSFTLPPLHEEGWFNVETSIKCQAVDGRLYNVPSSRLSSRQIKIRNARSTSR